MEADAPPVIHMAPPYCAGPPPPRQQSARVSPASAMEPSTHGGPRHSMGEGRTSAMQLTKPLSRIATDTDAPIS